MQIKSKFSPKRQLKNSFHYGVELLQLQKHRRSIPFMTLSVQFNNKIRTNFAFHLNVAFLPEKEQRQDQQKLEISIKQNNHSTYKSEALSQCESKQSLIQKLRVVQNTFFFVHVTVQYKPLNQVYQYCAKCAQVS